MIPSHPTPLTLFLPFQLNKKSHSSVKITGSLSDPILLYAKGAVPGYKSPLRC